MQILFYILQFNKLQKDDFSSYCRCCIKSDLELVLTMQRIKSELFQLGLILCGCLVHASMVLAAGVESSAIKGHAAIILWPASGHLPTREAKTAIRFFYQGRYHTALVRGTYTIIRSCDAEVPLAANIILQSGSNGVATPLSITMKAQEATYFILDVVEGQVTLTEQPLADKKINLLKGLRFIPHTISRTAFSADCPQLNEPEKDSDGDGVFDVIDVCPDTPLGHKVDEKGCELALPVEASVAEIPPSNIKVPEPVIPVVKPSSAEPVAFSDKSSAHVFFPVDEYALTTVDKAGIEDLKALSVSVKSLSPSKKLNIVGYADITGNVDYNLHLSIKRAKAVYDYLVSQGISRRLLSYEGKGSVVDDAPCEKDSGVSVDELALAIGEPTIGAKGPGIYWLQLWAGREENMALTNSLKERVLSNNLSYRLTDVGQDGWRRFLVGSFSDFVSAQKVQKQLKADNAFIRYVQREVSAKQLPASCYANSRRVDVFIQN